MAAPSRRTSGPVIRSLSPSGRFYSPSPSSSRSTNFLHRSTSPTRVSLHGAALSSGSVRFSLDRPISPSRSISVVKKSSSKSNPLPSPSGNRKRTCMCSPTNHPGSFRCALHKKFSNHAVSNPSNPLNARRSAMTNSLVRIGTVEGDLVKRALAALIRPSSHQQRRRSTFKPRPSRLSVMS